VVTFGWGRTFISGGPGPVNGGVDILVREDLRFEGELPDILTQSAMACCPGHTRRTTTTVKPRPVFSPVSRFDFSGQLREEGDIAVEFLRQTTDYCPGRHHLAVDHLKQLHRVDAQLSAQYEDVRAPGRAQIGDVLTELTNFRLWHVG
jgi:hypothetical protein